MRNTPPWRAWCLAPTLVLGSACNELATPEPLVCGNGVVEPEAGEACEADDELGPCGEVGTPFACTYVCESGEQCPPGMGCGIDGGCRVGNGTFSSAQVLDTDPVRWIDVADVDGDGVSDILSLAEGGEERSLTVYGRQGLDVVRRPGATVPGGALNETRAPLFAFDGTRRLVLTRTTGDLPTFAVHESDEGALVPTLFASQSSLGTNPIVPFTAENLAWPDGDLAMGLRGYRAIPLAPGLDALPPCGDPKDPVVDAGCYPILGTELDVHARDVVAAPSAGWPLDLSRPEFDTMIASYLCPVLAMPVPGQATPFSFNACAGRAHSFEDNIYRAAALTMPTLAFPDTLGAGVAWGDLNGDGLDDLVAQNDTSEAVVAYSVGDGTFHSSTPTPIEQGDGVFGTALHDLEGRLLAAEVRDGQTWFLTTFGFAKDCPEESVTCQPCCSEGVDGLDGVPVDLDGDGDLDLVGTRGGSGETLVILRRVDGGVVRITESLPGPGRMGAAGDIDGDGVDDVAFTVTEPDGEALYVLFGGSEVTAPIAFARGFDQIRGMTAYRPGGAEPHTFAALVDRGRPDGAEIVQIGATRLRQPRLSQTVVVSDHAEKADVVVVGRFDPNDPTRRVVVALGSEFPNDRARVTTWPQGEAGLLDTNEAQVQNSPVQLTGWFQDPLAHVVDIDHDGIDELVVIETVGGASSAVVLGPDPTGETPGLVVTGGTGFVDLTFSSGTDHLSAPIGSADVDGDGYEDIVALGSRAGQGAVAVFFGNADGTLVPDKVVAPTVPGAGAWSMLSVERVIEDGVADVVLSATDVGTWRWTFEVATGDTLTWDVVNGAPAARTVRRADVDGDGAADLVLGHQGGLSWMKANTG